MKNKLLDNKIEKNKKNCKKGKNKNKKLNENVDEKDDVKYNNTKELKDLFIDVEDNNILFRNCQRKLSKVHKTLKIILMNNYKKYLEKNVEEYH